MHRLYPNLFSPITIRGVTFKNRIMGAPTGSWLLYPGNYGTDYAVDYLEEKARGGCASVSIGDTEVNAGDPEQDTAGVYMDLRSPDGTFFLNQITAAVHQHGAKISLQLNHAGEFAGPSENQGKRGRIAREMTEEEILQVIDQFGTCAARLKQTGFDIVMLHGAHGWLLDQFFRKETNRRTDAWGGSLERRLRFPVEVAKRVRQEIGEHMLIEYRLSGCSPENAPEQFEELVALVHAMEPYIDIVHVSAGGSGGEKMSGTTFPTYLSPLMPNVHLAEALKARTTLPVVTVGSITTPELAEQILAEGKADFVALGRPLIADPEWPKKARKCQADRIRPCIGCHNCLEKMHATHILSCSVNPCAGAEHRLHRYRPTESQRVVVVGGGPAGMEAALRAEERGHRVTLLEKNAVLGGNLCHADEEPLKLRLKAYKDYLIRCVSRSGIDLRLSTEGTPELLRELAPEALILAVGSEPIRPRIPGIDRKNVYPATEIFRNVHDLSGKRVVVIGGNLVGCECAAGLKRSGAEVTVVEMTDTLYRDANRAVASGLRPLLEGVTCMTGAECREIGADFVLIRTKDGDKQLPADLAVIAVGMRPRKDVAAALEDLAPVVWQVGDVNRAATVYESVREAFWAAQDI